MFLFGGRGGGGKCPVPRFRGSGDKKKKGQESQFLGESGGDENIS